MEIEIKRQCNVMEIQEWSMEHNDKSEKDWKAY